MLNFDFANLLFMLAIAGFLFNAFFYKTTQQNIYLNKAHILASLSLIVLFFILLKAHIFYDDRFLHVINTCAKHDKLSYRIAAIWSDHNGSLFLFISFLNLIYLFFIKDINAKKIASIQILVLLLYCYFSSNPFALNKNLNFNDFNELNPALQNQHLLFHPPILYLGQSLSIAIFANCAFESIKKIKLYTTIAFLFTTIGLTLGARWAYIELGWGGFWFWDPIETLSLLYWLLLISIIHLPKNNEVLYRFLCAFSFSLIIFSIFIARGDLLSSIHSFANDKSHFLLLMLVFLFSLISAFFVAFIVVYKNKKEPILKIKLKTFANYFASFAFLIFIFYLILILSALIVFKNSSFDEPFYKKFLNIPIVLILFFISFIPCIIFKKNQKIIALHYLISAILTYFWTYNFSNNINYFAIMAAFISFSIFISSLNYIKDVFKKGFVLSHIGVAFAILGASHCESFTKTITEPIYPGKKITINDFDLCFIKSIETDDKHQLKCTMTFKYKDKILKPVKIFFKQSQKTKHITDCKTIGLDNMHLTIFTNQKDNVNFWCVEVIYKPLVQIFWFGLMLVVFGILVAIARRLIKRSA